MKSDNFFSLSKILKATLASFFIFAILSLAPIFLDKNVAFAKSYSMDNTNIDATLTSQGALNVNYERQYSFNGSYSCLILPFGNLSEGSKMAIDGVSIDRGGIDTPLSSVSFKTSWRNSGGPATACYSYDNERNTIYIFGDYSNEDIVVKVNYYVTNAVNVYADCAELYWQFCANYDDDSKNVVCNITLPTPTDGSIASDSILAWGHGDLTSKLTNNNDGKVSLSVPLVEGGSFAEVRVVFPNAWVDKSVIDSQAENSKTSKLDSIKAEENERLESSKATYQREKAISALMFWVPILLAILFIIACTILWFLYGRERKPNFTDKYFRDVPDKNAHPLTVARNENWGAGSTRDLTAEIMHLHLIDAIKIEHVQTTQERKILGDKIIDDFLISRTKKGEELENKADRATSIFLFDTIGKGMGREEGQVTFNDIKTYSKKNQEEMKAAYDAWQVSVGVVENTPEPLFDTKGMKLSSTLKWISAFMLLLSFVLVYFTVNLIPTLALLFSTLVCWIFSKIMRRRTQYGADLHAKSIALKNWLCDFTNLGERPPEDVKVWGEFMVYATILGVAKEAIEQLKLNEPNISEDDWGYGVMPYSWWWFYSPHTTFFSEGSGVSFFDNVLSNTMGSISAGTSFGDFGGGFSIGGGGGFGGGFGGGGAR